jgi:SWI/SNF-related matrix-associated actin-dependent regulator of chromatin subfamily A3
MRRLEAQGLLEETINPTPHGKRKVPAPIDLGIAGSSKGGTGSAAGGQDPAMQAMLDSLKKLKEDEKQANDVMVRNYVTLIALTVL